MPDYIGQNSLDEPYELIFHKKVSLQIKTAGPDVPYLEAYANVQIQNQNQESEQSSAIIQCKIDTGACFTVLPKAAAEHAGIAFPLNGLEYQMVSPIGSRPIKLIKTKNVDLVIQGKSIKSQLVLFYDDSQKGFYPILSLLDLVRTFPIGINRDHWYY